MSYNFDGKLVNQSPKIKNYTSAKSSCAKCSKLIDAPDISVLTVNNKTYTVRDYLNSEYFIYETKSGTAVVYCSRYCRNKHNHRFSK